MKYCGFWRPKSITSKWAIGIYNVYNILMGIFLYYITLSFAIGILQNLDDKDLVTDSGAILVNFVLLCFKMTYIFIYRDDFIAFLDMFLETICIPRNEKEVSIRESYLTHDRLISRVFMTQCMLTAVVVVIAPLTNGKDVQLIFRQWLPFEINSLTVFWATYVYQSVTMFVSCAIFAATEMLAAIMMQQICAQLETCMYRLLEIPEIYKQKNSKIDTYEQESLLLENCIEHHVYIFSIHKKLNHLFSTIVFVKFFGIMLNLCTLIYQLSQIKINNSKFMGEFMLLVSNIMRTLLYCWFGDNIIEKSTAVADIIYDMNWSLLTDKTKKKLIVIMMRSNRPLKLNGASFVIMSIATFVKVTHL